MEKAAKDAKKHMITVKLTKTNSILIRFLQNTKRADSNNTIPARGLVAGSALRNAPSLLASRCFNKDYEWKQE